MSKLSRYEKEDRKMLKRDLKMGKGILFSDKNRGITIAILPSIAQDKAQYAHVAVALLGDGDCWNRKYGEFVALDRLYSGSSISIPLQNWGGHMEDILYVARNAIVYMYDELG